MFDKIQNLAANIKKDQVMDLFAEVYGNQLLLPEQYHSILMQLPEHQHVYVMLDSNTGKLYGVGILLIENSFLHGGKTIGNLTEFIISKDIQNRGYGSLFLQYIERMAKYLYCRIMRVSIRNEINNWITKFYMKNGYHTMNTHVYEKKIGI